MVCWTVNVQLQGLRVKDTDSKEGATTGQGVLSMFACPKQADWSHRPHFNIVFKGKNISTCVDLTKFVLGTPYDVTSGNEYF